MIQQITKKLSHNSHLETFRRRLDCFSTDILLLVLLNKFLLALSIYLKSHFELKSVNFV
jgi:hypothetical protein